MHTVSVTKSDSVTVILMSDNVSDNVTDKVSDSITSKLSRSINLV